MKRVLVVFSLLFFAGTVSAQDTGSRFIVATPTVDTNIYASGDTVGSLMTFTAACSAKSLKVDILGVKVFDKAKQSSDLDLVLFNSSAPAGTFTDNAAFDPDDATLSSIVANIPITVHKAFSDNGMSQAQSILYPARCASNYNLYGYLVSRSTPTYAASSDVSVQIEVSPNY